MLTAVTDAMSFRRTTKKCLDSKMNTNHGIVARDSV